MRAAVLIAFALAFASAKPTIDPSTVTVSGISAGGAMAVQYGIAHSATVQAIGVIAGLPYYCAQGSVSGAFSCMDHPSTIEIGALNAYLNTSSTSGAIDFVGNISNQASMLFSGSLDTVVSPGSMVQLSQQLEQLGVSDMTTYFNISAEHAWITNYYGADCSTFASPYINNCNLDFAGNFVQMAFAHMGQKFNPTRGVQNIARLRVFSQMPFGASGPTNSLAAAGYVYIPAACDSSSPIETTVTCHVHVNFHGCKQNAKTIGTAYVAHTGLNQWADSNNIIVVYPQVDDNTALGNPDGCYDWWGYTGADYALKAGVQIKAIKNIVDHLIKEGSLPSA